MKKTIIGVLIAAATTVGGAAFAQAPQPAGPDPAWTPPAAPEPPPPPQAQAAPAYGAQSYAYAPPAPAATVVAPAPAGQWVYTNQYGWIWVPYADSYTYVAGPNVAYTYAYYPRFGWRWVISPWVLGFGPTPHWGRLGPSRFAWYGHPGYRGRYVARGWYGRPAYRAPAYRAPAPAWHGAVRVGGHHR